MARILVVEDERALAAALADNLTVEGHDAEVVHDGLAAVERLARGGIDLVLLDVMLPGADGWEVLRRLRRNGSDVPVIVLTALDAERDRVRGFDLGGDDYLVKPFALAELLARVRARLRRHPPAASGRFALRDGRHVDLASVAISDGGQLSRNELAALRILVARVGQVVERDALAAAVGVRGDGLRAVDMLIHRLREKIEADPAAPCHLVTVAGRGHRCDAAPI